MKFCLMGQERITPQRVLAPAVAGWRRPQECPPDRLQPAAESLRSNADDPVPLLERNFCLKPEFEKQGHRPNSQRIGPKRAWRQLPRQSAYLCHENA